MHVRTDQQDQFYTQLNKKWTTTKKPIIVTYKNTHTNYKPKNDEPN